VKAKEGEERLKVLFATTGRTFPVMVDQCRPNLPSSIMAGHALPYLVITPVLELRIFTLRSLFKQWRSLNTFLAGSKLAKLGIKDRTKISKVPW